MLGGGYLSTVMSRIAIAQFRPVKADYSGNLARAVAVMREATAGSDPADLLVFPETAFTGYFLEGGVRDAAVPAERFFDDLAGAHRASGAGPLEVVAGFYEVHRNRLHNSAIWASLGGTDAGIRHVHRKIFLPTYGVFDEERFVEAGRSIEAFDTRLGRAALLICEDVWHSITPTLAALDGAQLLLVPSASPARGLAPSPDGRPSSLERWERLAQDISSEHGVYVGVAPLVGFEGGKAFVGGAVFASPRGELLARGPVFEEGLVCATIDLDEITRARAEMPLLSDLEMRLPHLLRGAPARRVLGLPAGAPGEEEVPHVAPAISTPPRQAGAALRGRGADPLAIDPELTRRWLVAFIRDEVVTRRGFSKIVIGLSGGVDSALVAYLAAEAVGAEHVTAIRMPYRTSSPDSLAHAQQVIDALGIPSRTVDISAAVDGLGAAIGGQADGGRRGNIMARTRMITLFDLSAELRALPVGTGNKTERLFGYFTWHADDSPPVNPIGDLFKSQVWALARHVGVPAVIVEKPASADLIQGQTDEGDFGISYPRADVILHWLLQGYGAEEILPQGFTADEVALVRRRLDSTHWKRRLPTVAMVSQTAIGEYYLRPVDY